MPPQKRVRMGSTSAGASNSAPSTPPRLKTEEALKSALKKAPSQASTPTYSHQPQQARPKTLWALTRSVKLDPETSVSNPRQVDEEGTPKGRLEMMPNNYNMATDSSFHFPVCIDSAENFYTDIMAGTTTTSTSQSSYSIPQVQCSQTGLGYHYGILATGRVIP